MRYSLVRKLLVLAVIVLFIGTSIIPSLGSVSIKKPGSTENETSFKSFVSGGNMLYVGGGGPGNYSSIQAAINDANPGDTVFVYDDSSPYNENIWINKSINLIGETKENTIIDGSYKGCTINLTSENVKIKNFTITRGAGNEPKNWLRAGLLITGSNNIIINNIFENNNVGLHALRVTNLKIWDNTFINDGITFYTYFILREDRQPVKMEYFIHDIRNNTANGKPIYYFKDQNNMVVPFDAGQLIAVNCTNLIMKNANISNCEHAVILAYCSHCKIEHCKFSHTYGIWGLRSNNNIFQNNSFSDGPWHAIVLEYFVKNNKIRHNIINNNFGGVNIEWYSHNNIVTRNNFLNNNNSFFIKHSWMAGSMPF